MINKELHCGSEQQDSKYGNLLAYMAFSIG